MNPLNWRSLAPLSITFLLSTLSIPPGVFSAELPQPSKLQIRPSPKGKPDPIVVINRRTARRTALLASEQIDVLKKLQGAVYPAIVSALSPDGTTIVMAIHDPASKTPSFGLLNIQTGTRVAIEPESLRGFEPDGGWHWRDANTAVAIAIKHKSFGALESVLALVDRRNGKVKFQSLAPALDSGVPVKLAPSTQQVLVADHFSEPGGSGEQDDNDNGDEARPIEYRVVNLSDGKELTRFVIPTGNEASAFTWSPDSTQLAFIQNWEPEESQAIGGESLFSLVTQNAMGALSPVDNPRLQRNVLQVINLTTGKKHTVQASSGDGAIFSAVAWSPDAQTLLTQVIYPVVLEERSQPIYAWSEQWGFRAYTANLQNMTSFAPPELSSKDSNGTGFQFISSNEVIVRALNGMEGV